MGREGFPGGSRPIGLELRDTSCKKWLQNTEFFVKIYSFLITRVMPITCGFEGGGGALNEPVQSRGELRLGQWEGALAGRRSLVFGRGSVPGHPSHSALRG